MARLLFEQQGIRRRNGQLASRVTFVVYSDVGGTVLADISATSGGASIAGSEITTADIAGLGPAAFRFYGPASGQDTLYLRCPADPTLGVQEIEADEDERLDALEAGGGGAHPNLATHDALGLATDAELTTHGADTTSIHGITDTAQLVKLNATNTYTSASHNYFRSGKPWYDVMAFGAVGNGIADDFSPIQAAIDACSTAGGGTVFFPRGSYRITQGLTSTATNGIELLGSGGVGQDNTLSNGTTQILVDDSTIWGFTYNPANSSTFFAGPVIRNMQFRDIDGAAGGGIRLLKVSNYLIENVSCTDFVAGTGIHSHGTPNQYGTITNAVIGSCLLGINLLGCNGTRIIGGMIDGGSNNPANIIAGSCGVRITNGDTNMLMGTVIQCCEMLVQIVSGLYHELHGVRFEVWDTTALEVSADNCALYGGSFDNFLNGGIGTGIDVKAAATATMLLVGQMGSMATKMVDAGTSTLRVWLNDDHPSLILGDTDLYRSIANVLRTSDKFVADLGLGVGNSAAATTPGTVVKKIEVFDTAGASLGFVPVYNAIT